MNEKKRMSDTHKYNLERFLLAQEDDYALALREIRAGRKASNWIWYIFPQPKGLGQSYHSQFFGIDGIDEARAYYAHPVLRERLREITEALLTYKGRSVEDIMGGSFDALYLRSCMELFDQVAPDDIFEEVLAAFYGVEVKKPILNSFKVDVRFYAGEYPGDKPNNLESDRSKLQLFLDQGFTHFIDLTEEGELSPYSQWLPVGVCYQRFPIRDVSVPSDVEGVVSLIDSIYTILSDAGHKLYLHCRGGVGRTGMIVGCWYARKGMDLLSALQKTRQAFSDCPKAKSRQIPETPEQVAFIGNFIRSRQPAAVLSDSVITILSRSKEISLDKVKGCLVGGAVGDALGYPVEFMNYSSLWTKYGPKGITRYALDRNGIAEFSDDTQMTLFTATGLLAAESERIVKGIGDDANWAKQVASHYVDWYWTQCSDPDREHRSWLFEVPELHSRRAPGRTCMGSLRDLVRGIASDNNSKGCGGVMRVAPVALCRDLRESLPADFMYTLAGQVADITHNNPLGFMPAALIVMLIDSIGKCDQGITKELLKKLVLSCVTQLSGVKLHNGQGTYRRYPDAIGALGSLMMLAVDLADEERPDEACIREIGEGWTGDEALAIAVYCALKHTDSFEDAVVSAVNHSGDSDSTGAICGNIMGFIHGYDAIPAHYKEHLELLPLLEEVATDLYTGSAFTSNPEAWKKKYLEGHRADK